MTARPAPAASSPTALPAGIVAWIEATVAAATGDPAVGRDAQRAAAALRELVARADRSLAEYRRLARARQAPKGAP